MFPLIKLKQIEIIVSCILLKNKWNSFGRQKLLETSNMLKQKCSHIPNVLYLEPESDWVKTNTELAYFYQEKLHLKQEGFQKLASSLGKRKQLETLIISRTKHPNLRT